MSTNLAGIPRNTSMDAHQHIQPPNRGVVSSTTELPGVAPENIGIEPDHIPGFIKEFTAWDVYNNEARKVDNELVKDWTSSLNSLLLFVS
jgi:hypothetical protein